MDDLQFFRIVAGCETLTAASRELGWSLPVVSKRLSALEGRLNVRLVHRGARRLALTPEGRLYADRLEAVLDSVRQLEDQVSDLSSELRGRVKIESTRGLGRSHVAPLAGEFTRTHPELHVQIHTSAMPLRPHQREFDVAIQVGAPPDSSLRMRRLALNRRVPCAAPQYLARHGSPKRLEDLARHDCIILRESEGNYAVWRFGEAHDQRQVRVRGSLSSNDGDIVTAWALDGGGIVMRSEWQVRPFLESGQLVRVLPDLTTPAADIYALTAEGVHVPRRVSAFIDHLSARLPDRLDRRR